MEPIKPVHKSIAQAFGEHVHTGAVVFDARSPGEFALGHIPGSINLPLLDDEQRHEVGICYKTKGRQSAIDLGFEMAGPHFLDKIQEARRFATEGMAMVYCARGGLRSEIITWLLNKGGISSIQLTGGYKAWRNYCLTQFEIPRSWFVVTGMTGVGKTSILKALQQAGEAVLDLEHIAGHKGSAFGGLGLPEQSRQEQFENHLAVALAEIPADARCWMEDESRFIGKLRIPDALFQAKLKGSRIATERSFDTRIERVLEEYGGLPKEDLRDKTIQLTKRLGHDQVKLALEHLDAHDMQQWVSILLKYYDKMYEHGITTNKDSLIGHVWADGLSDEEIANQMIQIAKHTHVG